MNSPSNQVNHSESKEDVRGLHGREFGVTIPGVEKRQVVKGFAQEIIDRLLLFGGTTGHADHLTIMNKIPLFILLCSLLGSCKGPAGNAGSENNASRSGNPVIRPMYTADPSARVFNDTLWIYPSHDPDNAQWWDMVDYHVFSTTDMVNYTDHGTALHLRDITWAEKYAWAPDAIKRNGRYYFYFPTDQDNIGVAVGDRPNGPFTDPLGKPLISRHSPGVVNNRDFIDPAVFIDDDGQAYMFVGQIDLNAIKLNEDMISYTGDVWIIEGVDYFFEAIWIHRYNGRYYLSYAGKYGEGGDKILYAMSDNILGPYEFKGVIFDPVNSGTNHHSIVEYKGQWYFFYHTADLALQNIPDNSPDREFIKWRRSVCVDYLYYNPDGTIQKIIPTREGVKAIRGFRPAQKQSKKNNINSYTDQL